MAQPLLALLKKSHPETHIDVLALPSIAPVWRSMSEVSIVHEALFQHGSLQLLRRWRVARYLRNICYSRSFVLPNTFKAALIPFFANIPLRIGYHGEMRTGLLNIVHPGTGRSSIGMTMHYAALALDPGNNFNKGQSIPTPQLVISPLSTTRALREVGLDDHAPPLLVLAPGAAYGPAKRWPSRNFIALINFIATTGKPFQIVLTGSHQDENICQDIFHECISSSNYQNRITGTTLHNLAGKITLTQAIAVIAGAQAVVANDSGILHIASALNRPVIGLYGPTSPTKAPPFSDHAISLSLNLSCAPCEKRNCPLGHHKCMIDIMPMDVFLRLQQILSASAKRT